MQLLETISETIVLLEVNWRGVRHKVASETPNGKYIYLSDQEKTFWVPNDKFFPQPKKKSRGSKLGERILRPPDPLDVIASPSLELCGSCEQKVSRLVEIEKCDYRGYLLERQNICAKCCAKSKYVLPVNPSWKCRHGVYVPSDCSPHRNPACHCCRYEVADNTCLRCGKPENRLIEFEDRDLFKSDSSKPRTIDNTTIEKVCETCHGQLTMIQECSKRVASIVGELNLRQATDFGRMFMESDVVRECIAKVIRKLDTISNLQNSAGLHNYLTDLCKTTAIDMGKKERKAPLRHIVATDGEGNETSGENLHADGDLDKLPWGFKKRKRDGTFEIAVAAALHALGNAPHEPLTKQERRIFWRMYVEGVSGRKISEVYDAGELAGSPISKTQVYGIYERVFARVLETLKKRPSFYTDFFDARPSSRDKDGIFYQIKPNGLRAVQFRKRRLVTGLPESKDFAAQLFFSHAGHAGPLEIGDTCSKKELRVLPWFILPAFRFKYPIVPVSTSDRDYILNGYRPTVHKADGLLWSPPYIPESMRACGCGSELLPRAVPTVQDDPPAQLNWACVCGERFYSGRPGYFGGRFPNRQECPKHGYPNERRSSFLTKDTQPFSLYGGQHELKELVAAVESL